jgi:cytidylate kinase
MNFRRSSEHLTEALGNAYLHWQKTRKEAVSGERAEPPNFTIALTRESGAGGTEVAREVAARLGWTLYDYELLQKIADEMKVHSRLLESVDEKKSSWLLENLESFTATPSVSESAYIHRLLKTVRLLAAHGDCVIVGRGAVHVLPPQSTLRVRLVAPRDARIAAKRRKLGLSEPEAARLVDTTDRERTRFITDHFHRDPANPCDYDLVLNSSRFGVTECAELIIEALSRLQAKKGTSAALRSTPAEVLSP